MSQPQLPSIGVAQEFISFRNTTMESDKYICIRETGAQNQVVIVDMATPLTPQRRQITADSALMCPDKKVIALKATTPGLAGDALQVFNLDTKTKLKSHQMPESVEFWKWITPNMLGLVTASSVYHWDVQVRGVTRGQGSSTGGRWRRQWMRGRAQQISLSFSGFSTSSKVGHGCQPSCRAHLDCSLLTRLGYGAP